MPRPTLTRLSAATVTLAVFMTACGTTSDKPASPNVGGASSLLPGTQPSTQAQGVTAAPLHPLGQAAAVTSNIAGRRLVVTVVKVDRHARGVDVTAATGKRLLAVQLRVTNRGARYKNGAGENLYAIDSTGEVFRADNATNVKDGPSFPDTVDLVTGDSVLGWMTFTVPTSAKITRIRYTVTFGEGSKPEWSLISRKPSRSKATTVADRASQLVGDRTANSDARGIVATAETCFAATGKYPTGKGSSPVQLTASGNLPGCSAASVTLSQGTVLHWYAAAVNSQSYVIVTHNASGTPGTFLCYDSKTGGSVTTVHNDSEAAC